MVMFAHLDCPMARSMPVAGDDMPTATNATSFSRPCRLPAAIAGQRSPSSASQRSCLHAPSLCRYSAGPAAGLRRQLSVRACHQRPDHRRTVVFAIRGPALARAAAARQRISVHRRRRRRRTPSPSPDCSRRRVVQCGTADHGLALHGLARRVSASRARLCAAESRDGGAKIRGPPARRDHEQHRCRHASRSRPSPGSLPRSTTSCRSCSAADATRLS